MRVLVSAQAPDIGAPVDPRFGRAAHFVIVDLDTGEWTTLPNTGRAASQGAGIDAGRFAADQRVDAVITGAAGPNAQRALQAAGVSVFLTSRGTVADAIDDLRAGVLPRADEASVGGGAGMGGGRGGVGMGQGRGRGSGGQARGTGAGQGRGRGRGRGAGGSAAV
jgi:predicted Fe-Mo cluster-binding NifX family protein